MSAPHSRWHDQKRYFGLHYDLHAGEKDTLLGTQCSPDKLIPMLKLMMPDFVQTDCKGHAGYVSWFSKTKDASVPSGLKVDALKQWRAATKKLGLPLHCHYSGVWDAAIAKKHPEWCVVAFSDAKDELKGQNSFTKPSQKMCVRSDYVTEFMIPQMLELIDDYEVDGFWIDGDIWSVEPCYCERCRAAWTKQTGFTELPVEGSDPNWPRWWSFMLDSFNEYVTTYTEAVHAHKSGVLVCSNWLQTFCNPGEPHVPTDWISGDNTWAFGLDGSRCEARFLSTRKKHWDIMLWSFMKSGDMNNPALSWFTKPAQMMMQEAAILLSFGGSVQLYEHAASPLLRNGQLVPWQMQRLGEVGRFVKARRTLCQNSQTIPQIAVLHSEHHLRITTTGTNLLSSPDVTPVRGAVYALAEKHYGVDVLDEWALLPRLNEFPVVVVPERHGLSLEMAAALQQYVRQGGKLLITGAESLDVFGEDFVGVQRIELASDRTYYVPAGEGAAPFYSAEWMLLKPKKAHALFQLSETANTKEYITKFPAATLHEVGKGKVAFIPCTIFRDFQRERIPAQRDFIANVMNALAGKFDQMVEAPSYVEAVYRKKGNKQLIHLINRNSGLPTAPGNPVVDEISSVGPLTVTIKLPAEPTKVSLAFEKSGMEWSYSRAKLRVEISRIHIHAALVIES